MLHEDEGHLRVGREFLQQLLEGLKSACRGAHPDNREGVRSGRPARACRHCCRAPSRCSTMLH